MLNNPVVIYFSKLGCPYCDKLAALLAARNIPNIKLTLDAPGNFGFARAEFESLADEKLTFPQVFMRGERVGGYDDFVKLLG